MQRAAASRPHTLDFTAAPAVDLLFYTVLILDYFRHNEYFTNIHEKGQQEARAPTEPAEPPRRLDRTPTSRLRPQARWLAYLRGAGAAGSGGPPCAAPLATVRCRLLSVRLQHRQARSLFLF